MENENNEQVVEETKFQSAGDDSVLKVDLSKPPTQNETPEQETTDGTTDDSGVAGSDENTEPVQEQEEVQPEAEAQEQPVVEEITAEEAEQAVEEQVEEVAEQVEEAIAEAETTGKPLPENIQKLIDFMDETGGDLEDYVKLNQDYSKLDT